jgi:hypothetical protein
MGNVPYLPEDRAQNRSKAITVNYVIAEVFIVQVTLT